MDFIFGSIKVDQYFVSTAHGLLIFCIAPNILKSCFKSASTVYKWLILPIFPKAAVATTKEFMKSASDNIKGFPKAPGVDNLPSEHQ